MLIYNGFIFLLERNSIPRGLYPVGEVADVGVVFFRLASGVQEPVFGKSNFVVRELYCIQWPILTCYTSKTYRVLDNNNSGKLNSWIRDQEIWSCFLVSTPLSVAHWGLRQKQAEKTIRWLCALFINASWKIALENVQCHQVRIPCYHEGIHDCVLGKITYRGIFTVLKLIDTSVNLQVCLL